METLADRLRDVLVDLSNEVEEKRMFGGTAFMVRGHMAMGVTNKDLLMVRVDPARALELLKEEHVRPMDFTGRPMRGFLYVDTGATEERGDLLRWAKEALAYNAGLAKKPALK